MIHRQYVCKLAVDGGGNNYPSLDIITSLPGSYQAPVGLQASYPTAPPMTVPPTGWAAAGNMNWYYEIRSRALRVPNPSGTPGFTPRLNLGGYLAIVPLANDNGTLTSAGAIPPVARSASLALPPSASTVLCPSIPAFADPAYGPVIRLRNSVVLYVVGQNVEGAYFLVSLGLAENKDEDWANLGHA